MKHNNPQKETSDELIFGTNALIEVIKSGKTISKVFIDKAPGKTNNKELLNLIKEKAIPTSYVPKIKLDKLTDKNHQGVIGLMAPIDFYDLEKIVQTVLKKGEAPFFLILNNITDVRNIGAIVRTADCVGIDAIIIEWSGCALNGDCMKTSAGALARVPICRTANLQSTLNFLKNNKINIVACTEKTESDIYSADLKKPLALLMGSEGFGIDSQILKQADIKMKIPMKGTISSLNVSVAAAISMYEVLRQRNI